MSFDSKKTILLEKTYFYVRASLGFQLEGTSTEKIPTNNGFYRFFVDNLQKAIGNSYVNVLYDSQDLTLQCFCSDLYMDELMSSDSSAIEDVVEELKKNTTTIIEFENGVSSALSSNHEDNVLLHADNESINSNLSSLLSSLNTKDSFYSYNQFFTVDPSQGSSNSARSFLLSFRDFVFEPLYGVYVYRLNENFFHQYTSSLPVFNFLLKNFYSNNSSNGVRCNASFTFYRPSSGIFSSTVKNVGSNSSGEISVSPSFGLKRNDIFVHFDICIEITKELYNYMVFCDNFFSDRYSFSENSIVRGSSYMDSIYLDIEPNLNSCIFSHKLDITKKFDSIQDYKLCVFAPTSLSNDMLLSISNVYVVVNGQQKTFVTAFTKVGDSFPEFHITLSGESFYHISSISFESVF